MNQGAYRSWPLHRVGQPDIERDLRRLSRSADKEEERDQGHLLRPEEMGASLQCRKINTPDSLTAHFPDEEQDAQEKAEIADPVNNKSLVAGYSIRVVLVPEANQEVRAEPHALPADKEEQEIIGHDQHQHKKDKEVEIGEVAHHPLVMAHVSERIDVNQQADAADDQKHDRAQGVDLEGNLRLKRSRLDPGKESSNGVGINKNGYLELDISKVNIDMHHLWVANSPEATVSKVDTNTGAEVGRYKICTSPSRTSVDLNGDVWVGCRNDGGVAKIINQKSKCIDKNGNGQIETSEDLNKDTHIQPNEMVSNDECIQFIVYPDGATVARAAGVDKENHAWIGFWNSKHLRRLHPNTGASVVSVDLPCSPYGLVIDQMGIIWIQGSGCGLVRVDPQTLAVSKLSPPFGYSAYGINVDMFGKIWLGGGWGAVRYDPVANQWLKANGVSSSSAVATGTDGYTYVVNDGPSTVTKINSVTATVEGTIALGAGRGPHGVAMDFSGFVWAVNLSKGTVSKCDPKPMQMIGEYKVGSSPYTYSDMTGYTLGNFTAPKGHYTHVFGFTGWAGTVNETQTTTMWETMEVDAIIPPKGFLKIRYVVADTLKALDINSWSAEFGPFPPQQFPIDLKAANVIGRFLKVEVFLQAGEDKLSPIVKSISAKGKSIASK